MMNMKESFPQLDLHRITVIDPMQSFESSTSELDMGSPSIAAMPSPSRLRKLGAFASSNQDMFFDGCSRNTGCTRIVPAEADTENQSRSVDSGEISKIDAQSAFASLQRDDAAEETTRLRAERDSERVVKRDAQAALRERHSEKPRNTSTKVAHDAGAVDEVADDCAVTRQPSWSSEPAGGNRQIANPGISTSKPSYPASHARSAPDSFAIRGRGGGEVRIMDEVLMYPRRGTFRVGSAKPRGSHIVVMIGATSRPLPNNSSTTHSRSNLTERANRMRAAIYGPLAEVAEGEMTSSTAPCVDASRRLILEDSFQQTKTNADGVGVAQCQVDAPFPLVVEEAVAGKCKQSATTLSSGCAASARRIRRSSLPTSSDEVIFSSSLHAASALQGNERDLVRRARQRAEYARHWEAGGGDVVANLLAPPAKVHDCKTPNALDHIRRRVMRLSDASTGSDASSDGSSDAHDITPSERSERRHRHKFARATSNTSA